VFTESSPLEQLFEAQLDLFHLRSLDFPVFRNEVPTGLARTPDGTGWDPTGTGFRSKDGGPAAAVTVASNADHRWGPGAWEQVDWWNQVTPTTGSVRFRAHAPRRLMALGAGLWLLALGGIWVMGRLKEKA
jgi:hypothetical protein